MTANMESSTGSQLIHQAEKTLLHPIHPHLISYCPTMDLIAIVTDEENLDVYRINGQRAFGLKRKNPNASVDCICWEFNGQAIAVAWSDGLTDVLSAETGKVIHPNVPAPSTGTETARIQCIGWGLNFIDVESVKRRTGLREQKKKGNTRVALDAVTTEDWDAFKDDTTIEDYLERQPDFQALDIAPDLPDQLAMLDRESLLPKLSPIPLPPANPFMRPGAQADNGAFGSQAEVDSLLHAYQMKDYNSVDMFIRCTDKGTVHPSIYDSLETVNIRLPSAWAIESSRPILHTSHPYSCSHGLLTEVKTATQKKLAFVPLTLGFIPSAGIYLHLISSKTSHLQNLLLYIQQCLQRIRVYWKHAHDLPSKFMMNITETLEEKGQGDLVQNLYHLACTGNCPELIKEWLTDELQEAGHKRWDTTVVSSLTTLLQIIHENLLPALDRCSIVISRLRGLAEYHDSGWITNTPVQDFTALLEFINNLRLLSHTTLLYANDEKRQFHSFSKWLRYEIDFEATEPNSQSRAEMETRDPGVDIGVVLEYIQYGLMESDLTPYLQPEDDLPSAQKTAPTSSYAETLKAIDLLRESANYKPEALCLDRIFRQLNTGCTNLFQRISQWQESNITMDCGIVLEEDIDVTENGIMDMRMVFQDNIIVQNTSHTSEVAHYISRLSKGLSKLTLSEPAYPDSITTYILFAPDDSASTTDDSNSESHSRLNIHKLTHTPTISALPKSLHSYSLSTLTFQHHRILDAKFADDESLLVLLQTINDDDEDDEKEKCSILYIAYTSTPSSDEPSPITYTPVTPRALPSSTSSAPPITHPTTTFSEQEIRKHTRHTFEGRFTPLKLIVNGRKGRRAMVVLGSDRKHYQVLDMDYREGREEAEGSKTEGEKGSGERERSGDVDVDMVGV